jgi:hypothetical protein
MRFLSDTERAVRQAREEILWQATTHVSGDPLEGLSVTNRIRLIGQEMVEAAVLNSAVANLAVSHAIDQYDRRFQS